MRNFDTAARRGAAAVNNPVDITFTIDGAELTAHPPTTGQIALFMASQGDGGLAMVQAMFDFLGWILDDGDVDVVRGKLEEGVEISLVSDIITYLMEEWSGRPTKPSSASSGSRGGTGKSSTAKRRAATSTR